MNRSPEHMYKNIIQDLIREVNDLKNWRRNIVGNSPLFDIANENTPATITVSQNDYDPGNYDVLRLDATGAVSITGISGGKKGRFLTLLNVSAFNISLPHESGLSAAANRIINSTAGTITLSPDEHIRLYYDFTQLRWVA